MKSSTPLKALLVVVSVTCGGSIALALLAKQDVQDAKATLPAGEAGQKITATHQIQNFSRGDPRIPPLPVVDAKALEKAKRTLVSSFSTQRFGVLVVGNEVTVSTAVSMYDKRPQRRFRWSLRVFDEAKKIKFFDRKYDDQVFSLTPGEHSVPTFDETIKLGPGTYNVEVFVHGYNEGFDLDKLKDRTSDWDHRVASSIQKFVVPR